MKLDIGMNVVIGMYDNLANLSCVLCVNVEDAERAVTCIRNGWAKWNAQYDTENTDNLPEINWDKVKPTELVGDGYNDYVRIYLNQNNIWYEDLSDQSEEGTIPEYIINWYEY